MEANAQGMAAIPQPVEDESVVHRDSIGGYALLPKDESWPLCPASGKHMVLFLQLDLRAEFGLGLPEGWHLSVFMSPEVNEIPSFEFPEADELLDEKFWEQREPHCRVFLHHRDQESRSKRIDPYLAYRRLEFHHLDVSSDSPHSTDIVVGGGPAWLQDPQVPASPHGDPLLFLMQVPENYPFPRRQDAPEQPDSFSAADYCLFLGNSVYVFAVPGNDHPESVWITVQS